MVNRVAYRSFPDKDEFSELYKTHTQKQLCEVYGCNESRIRKWVVHFGLVLRPQGGGNNRKFYVSVEALKSLVDVGLTNSKIAKNLGMSVSNLNKLLSKFGIKRQYNTTEYKRYARKVRQLTDVTYAKYREVLNPDHHVRTLCGVKGGYQLDHIISIRDCFDTGVSADDCAKLENLQIIPWEKNLQKRTYLAGDVSYDRLGRFDMGYSKRT
jgi:hypothetical protein